MEGLRGKRDGERREQKARKEKEGDERNRMEWGERKKGEEERKRELSLANMNLDFTFLLLGSTLCSEKNTFIFWSVPSVMGKGYLWDWCLCCLCGGL